MRSQSFKEALLSEKTKVKVEIEALKVKDMDSVKDSIEIIDRWEKIRSLERYLDKINRLLTRKT